MKIVSKLKEDLYLIYFSEDEVDELYNYINFEDHGIEIVEGENVFTTSTLDIIYERLEDIEYHSKLTYGIFEQLQYLV